MFGTREINNDENIIDSRDVIKRIEELESDLEGAYEAFITPMRDVYEDACEDGKIDEDETSFEDWMKAQGKSFEEWKKQQEEIDTTELDNLKKLTEELESYGDWSNGATLIRESYFPEYVKEFAKDCGDIPDLPEYVVIDWKATAENLKDDYTEADFDGVTYYMGV